MEGASHLLKNTVSYGHWPCRGGWPVSRGLSLTSAPERPGQYILSELEWNWIWENRLLTKPYFFPRPDALPLTQPHHTSSRAGPATIIQNSIAIYLWQRLNDTPPDALPETTTTTKNGTCTAIRWSTFVS